MTGQPNWAELNRILAEVDPNVAWQLRDAIAAIYDVIAQIPGMQLQDFKRFTEDVLTQGQATRAAAIWNGDIAVREDVNDWATLLDAAQLLRAIEVNALECANSIESDLEEDLEAAWLTSDGRHYVVPRLAVLRAVDGKPFVRRALLHNRVLPTEIGGLRVRLHRSCLAANSAQAALERDGNDRRFGAALFPGLSAVIVPKEGPDFTVADLTGFDAASVISGHLERGRAEGCAAIVWGELTMPTASLDLITRQLAETALDDKPAFQYLVAGSWHHHAGGVTRNISVVLDGTGEPLFEVSKWARFVFAGRTEDIAPGNEAHVLICEDELMTVAVCRDFLDVEGDRPYCALNVDVAIVPSMISSPRETATLKGHAATADCMRVRFGTRTLVVAQPAVPSGEVVGQVLEFPAQPLEAEPVLVQGAWHLCVLERP